MRGILKEYARHLQYTGVAVTVAEDDPTLCLDIAEGAGRRRLLYAPRIEREPDADIVVSLAAINNSIIKELNLRSRIWSTSRCAKRSISPERCGKRSGIIFPDTVYDSMSIHSLPQRVGCAQADRTLTITPFLHRDPLRDHSVNLSRSLHHAFGGRVQTK